MRCEDRSGPIERGLRAGARLWYVRRLVELQQVPAPEAAAPRPAPGPEEDRVLLIGNGFTHGWGTRSHGLALTGCLEAALTRGSQRGTVVEYAGAEIMDLASVEPWLDGLPLPDYDLVVLVLSLNDALRLSPVGRYRDDMRNLLATLTSSMRPGAAILVAGIHQVRGLPGYGGPAGRVVQRHADRLNAAVREVVAGSPTAEFLDLPAPVPEPGRPHGSPAMYAAWSEAFAEPAVRLLEQARLVRDDAERPSAEHEWAWEDGRQVVAAAHGGELGGRLSGLAEQAKREFGVDLAYVTLVDGERQFYLANTAVGGAIEAPLSLSHCQETVKGDAPLVVPNSFRDPRFRDNPLIAVPQFRFYAGVPLKDADGVTVGTFCVSSVLAHRAGYVSTDRLTAYAEEAQQELHRALDDTAHREAVTTA